MKSGWWPEPGVSLEIEGGAKRSSVVDVDQGFRTRASECCRLKEVDIKKAAMDLAFGLGVEVEATAMFEELYRIEVCERAMPSTGER
jgi:hypothetical protein